jgi:ABC-2 type transport system permease protein
MTLSQVTYVNKAFWRNPTRAFFTFAFPLMFLVIFTSLLGSGTLHLGTATVKLSTYYVAAMASFAVINACFTNMAITMTFQRDAGILKRTNGTPLPTGAFLGSRVLHTTAIALALVAITGVFGHAAYSADIPSGVALLQLVAMLAVGAAAFSALALALTAFIPNADASGAVVNGVVLPLLFLSGIFIAFGNHTPTWVTWTARLFPFRHFALGMQAAFLGTPFHWSDVLVVALWGVAGLVVAIRHFTWEPRT